jgi:signal transduction histidine kinase
VTIRDNGSGFDPDHAASPTSLGLLSMRERAAAIGATLEIASRPGAGTAIILERPTGDDLVPERLTDDGDGEAEPAAAGESLVARR